LPIPARAILEISDEPNPTLFEKRLDSLLGLLRLALRAELEQSLPTGLRVLLDLAQNVVQSDRQLVVFSDRQGHDSQLVLGRRFDPPEVPEVRTNLLHGWSAELCKPLLVERGWDGEMDGFLDRVGATAALAAPLFLERDFTGSIQLFRTVGGFTAADAHLLWFLSLLAENQVMRIRMVQRLTRAAYTDFLTGLRTRGYFEQALEQEVRRAQRKATSCCLLLIDLDNFKQVNDRFGHHAGDDVLRQFARILAHDMRDIDTVARFGGDEFSVILPDTNQEGAHFVAARIREGVRNHRFAIPDDEAKLQINLSIGIALCPGNEITPQQLLRAADAALYQAKQRGRDRQYFGEEKRAG
jgi:diguanylate cyclase (GGDEF)-like protein